MNNITEYSKQIFDDIKHTSENGCEYWYARELMKVLKYSEFRKFYPVIEKAMKSCNISEQDINNHFAHVDGMVTIGSQAKRKQVDYKLSRYACYLIVQNADARKVPVALGQTYFAIQTRKQELNDMEYGFLTEDEKRLYQRNLTKKGNFSLNQVAKMAGVRHFDIFHNYVYRGLYNGETADDF